MSSSSSSSSLKFTKTKSHGVPLSKITGQGEHKTIMIRYKSKIFYPKRYYDQSEKKSKQDSRSLNETELEACWKQLLKVVSDFRAMNSEQRLNVVARINIILQAFRNNHNIIKFDKVRKINSMSQVFSLFYSAVTDTEFVLQKQAKPQPKVKPAWACESNCCCEDCCHCPQPWQPEEETFMTLLTEMFFVRQCKQHKREFFIDLYRDLINLIPKTD